MEKACFTFISVCRIYQEKLERNSREREERDGVAELEGSKGTVQGGEICASPYAPRGAKSIDEMMEIYIVKQMKKPKPCY